MFLKIPMEKRENLYYLLIFYFNVYYIAYSNYFPYLCGRKIKVKQINIGG